MHSALATVLLVACTPTVALPPATVAGSPVTYYSADLGGANAGAAWVDGEPVVYLAPGWHNLPPTGQWFALIHELCHLDGAAQEVDADCCTGRRLRALDIPVHLAAEYLAAQPAGLHHPPGNERALHMLMCYYEGSVLSQVEDAGASRRNFCPTGALVSTMDSRPTRR